MKKYMVCICDDEQPIRDKLKKYITVFLRI